MASFASVKTQSWKARKTSPIKQGNTKLSRWPNNSSGMWSGSAGSHAFEKKNLGDGEGKLGPCRRGIYRDRGEGQ